jgi:sucrose-6-phosphate hydrolase SacC (GH32 family)
VIAEGDEAKAAFQEATATAIGDHQPGPSASVRPEGSGRCVIGDWLERVCAPRNQDKGTMMKTLTATLTLGFAALALSRLAAAETDKTLVSWVALANTTQQGGSALTLQRGDQFDAIVFGEREPGRWMAGSNVFARTQGDQRPNAAEKAGDIPLVQMAIVYQGNRIAIYRNGRPYTSYTASNIDLLSAEDNMAVFGLRHQGAGTGQTLLGSIEDARIYARALGIEEIRQLKPKKESAIKPYAWWTFEKGRETDRMGRFPVNALSGGAAIEGGRLVLPNEGATLIAATATTLRLIQTGTETPAMPANPPADWLTYHLFHPGPGGAMPGDPNCAFYWKGRYHLHYIYNHKFGFAFAHVSSDDMLHWKWHPTTLEPRFTGHGMFSGTGFITKEGRPAIIYHGQGSGRNQLAFALDDDLEQWTKPVPILPRDSSGKEAQMNHWDPDCWLNGGVYYALSGGGNPSLMKSSDLKSWTFLGPLLHDDYPANLGMAKGEDISCANMFKLGNKWMLLCISHRLGCRYYLGDFKHEKYLPESQAMMSWNGNNFFAPESVLTKDGRRVMWAWMMNLPVANCGLQSLPRELEVPDDGVLRIRPVRELELLRGEKKQEAGVVVKGEAARQLKEIGGRAIELEAVFSSPQAREVGLDVLCDGRGENGLRVAVAADRKTLSVGNVQAPFALKAGEDLTLHVFIDHGVVEVFANDRQAAVAACKYVAENLGIRVFSRGGDTTVKRITGWKMKSIYAAP